MFKSNYVFDMLMRSAKNVGLLLRTPAPVRPIVIIQSDDWGRVGIPSSIVIEELKAAGFHVGNSLWDQYGLETTDDVDQLTRVLTEFRDVDGHPACFTANFILANADLKAMAADHWREFKWKSIGDGFPEPWDDHLVPAYRRAIDAGVFYAALHGFTHFNSPVMISALRDEEDLGRRARSLAERDIPYLRSMTPEYNFALASYDSLGEHFLSQAEQASWIEQGVRLFEEVFATTPVSTCAPGYRATDQTFSLFRRAGIAIVQDTGGIIPTDRNGLLFLSRNVSFEPVLSDDNLVELAIGQAKRAVAAAVPIIICSHSINYISRFINQAEFGRKALGRLLTALLAEFPNIRFANDAEFLVAWKNHSPEWFRSSTVAEKMERCRLLYKSMNRPRIVTKAAQPEEEHLASTYWEKGIDQAKIRQAAITDATSDTNVGDAIDFEAQASFRYRSATQTLGRQSLYVLLGSVFTLVVGFPLQIYISRILGASGLGVFSLLEGTIATISSFLGLGVAQTIVRFVPYHLARGDYRSVRELIRLGGFVLLGVGVGAYLALLSSFDWIRDLIPQIAEHGDIAAVMGIMIPLGLILYFLQQGLRGFHEIRYLVMGSSFLQLVIKAALTVALFTMGFGLFGYVWAVVLSTFGAAFWMAIGLRRKVQALPKVSAEPVEHTHLEWYRFAFVFYCTTLVGGLMAYVDRFVLGYNSGVQAVGIFVIVRQLVQMPAMFNQMLLMVGAPMFAAAHGRKDAEERQHLFNLINDWVVRASLPLLVFFTLFGDHVLGLYGEEFATGGTTALLILIAAQFVSLACGPVGNVVLMSGLERYSLWVTIFTTIASAVLLIVLIPHFGIVGAAVATAVGWLIGNPVLIVIARRKLDLHWWSRRQLGWLLPTLATLLFGVVARGIGLGAGATSLGGILIGMYIAFLGISLIRGLHQDDIVLLRDFRDRFLNR
jgi:O-antigen/teichoic acid export membrane protein